MSTSREVRYYVVCDLCGARDGPIEDTSGHRWEAHLRAAGDDDTVYEIIERHGSDWRVCEHICDACRQELESALTACRARRGGGS